MYINLANVRKDMRIIECNTSYIALESAHPECWNGSYGWLCRVKEESTGITDEFFESLQCAGSLNLVRLE